MNLDTLVIIALVLAAVPCALFFLNLLVYRPLPQTGGREESPSAGSTAAPTPIFSEDCGVSVLIPARNEEQNIRSTLTAALDSCNPHDEVVVLDDHSTDRTAEIVRSIAALDTRVRLESAPPLPAGWCGKQHACHVLAGRARHPLLLFLDADVQLAPDALARMRAFMEDSGAALASGVPQQELGTFSEQLLIPLIHFILLGFLPMHGMRRTRWASMSAGCGQLFIVRRDAYAACGGHARLKDSMHDGIKLPRVFRRAGFRTDLFDATDLATCRMYHTNGDTWRGLGKNATEGLAAPGTIGPMTALLLGGQVLPFLLLGFAPALSTSALFGAALAGLLAYGPRLVAARMFRQPLGGAWLHPAGVLGLMAIQWHALIRRLLGKPASWKGRSYATTPQLTQAKAL
ncbi:MAG TPA: glycosyltransferase family 2 protein [Verrucomicrobiae bacterium]